MKRYSLILLYFICYTLSVINDNYFFPVTTIKNPVFQST